MLLSQSDSAETRRFLKLGEYLHLEASLGASDCKTSIFIGLGRGRHSSRTGTTNFKKSILNEPGDLVEGISWEGNLKDKWMKES